MTDKRESTEQLLTSLLEANTEAIELLRKIVRSKNMDDSSIPGLAESSNAYNAIQLSKQVDAAKFIVEQSTTLIPVLKNASRKLGVSGSV